MLFLAGDTQGGDTIMSSLPILPSALAAKIDSTQKGNKMLIDDKLFEYIKKDEKGGATYWICRKKKLLKCSAKCAKATTVTNDQGEVIIREKTISQQRSHE